MKTKFTLSDSFFDTYDIELRKKEYEKYFKEYGWLFDDKFGDVYMIINKEIQLKEGDRVCLDGIRLVTWKCLHILEDYIEYILEEE